MERTLTFSRMEDLTPDERAELRALSAAVYPPAEAAAWPGRHLEWSPAEWQLRVRTTEGRLAAAMGIVRREAELNGQPVTVGGIGGVMTHPDFRRQGHAGAAVRHAMEFFRDTCAADFGLLVCEPRLIVWYCSLGWQEFTGELWVLQFGSPAIFTFNRVLTCPVRGPAPLAGTIHLNGPPW